jgi:GNAT superfamily N-acetyltransferase
MRPYRDEDDYDRIRAFLRDVFLANGRREHSWGVARLDYWRWHVVAVVPGALPFEQAVFLWEQDGEIIAAMNGEDPGDAHLQVHPRHRTPALEAEMIEAAEAYLPVAGDGVRRLAVWAHDDDPVRIRLLEQRGYAPAAGFVQQNRIEITGPSPVPAASPGYTLRALGGPEELPARSWASWRAFHPDAPDSEYEGFDWYAVNIQRQPLYRRDLDLVAITGDGTIASFTTVWYDDVTRSAYFEPVGTAPEFQRRGLARALLAEGLSRVQRLGARTASVHGGTEHANALYAATGFVEFDAIRPWRREWPDSDSTSRPAAG